jgi:hypothetical protein
MRRRFVLSLVYLLASVCTTFGQRPQVAQSESQGQVTPPGFPASVLPGPSAEGPAADPPRSSHWPTTGGTIAPYLLFGSGPLAEEGGRSTVGIGLGDDAKEPGTVPWIWGDVEYLLWWIKDGPLPVPLVTTSSAASQGILGRPDTAVLFGGSGIEYRAFSGGRFTLGLWCDDGQTMGIEASGFFLERSTRDFEAVSTITGTPLLARPFVNALTRQETSELVAAPGQFQGTISVQPSSALYGWDLNAIGNFKRDKSLNLDWVVGFRFLQLDERMAIVQNSNFLEGGFSGFGGAVIQQPALISVFDRFATRNEFYGGQLGARAEYLLGSFFLHLLGKVGLGGSHEVAFIDGSSTLNQPGQPTHVLSGGLLAVSSNIGRQVHDDFSVVPEFGINVGYQVCRSMRAYIGYTILYWSDVARPGDLINRTVNPTLVPTSQAFGNATGPAQPAPIFSHGEFWAQGMNFGLEFRY